MCKRMKYQEIDFSKVIAVSNRHLTRLPYLEQADRICSFHPRAFLLREKDLPPEEYLRLAEEVKRICDRHHVTMMAHFYPEAAERIGSRFLHLPLWKLKELRRGSCEAPDEETNGVTGEVRDDENRVKTSGVPQNSTPQNPMPQKGGLKIGVSVHSAEEAREAVRLGTSYLTAGHIFATDCKKGVPPRGLEFLKGICELAPVPVYGIGGIRLDPEQIREVLAQGAAGACIMSQMMRM